MITSSTQANSTTRDESPGIDWKAPPDRFLDVGHSRIAYRRCGQGPDVLFIHGWPLAGSTWRGVIAHLRADFTCHVLDLPGAGDTECRDLSVIELGEHARTVSAAIEQLGLDRFALVAHDSGGLVATYVAAELGERVTALVMGNTEIPGHTPWQIGMYMAATKLPGGLKLFVKALSVGWLLRSDAAFGACFDDLSILEGEFHERVIAPILDDPTRREGTLRLIKNAKMQPLRELAAAQREVTAPTRLIWGADDPFFPLAEAQGMRKRFGSGAELVELRPGKLFVHEERPEDFARATGEFLTRVTGG